MKRLVIWIPALAILAVAMFVAHDGAASPAELSCPAAGHVGAVCTDKSIDMMARADVR